MPRGRKPGSINRLPGIYGQSADKVRIPDPENPGKTLIDRSRVHVVIDFNDDDGNRYQQTFEVRRKKDGTGVYIPTGAQLGSDPGFDPAPQLVSPAPEGEEAE